MKSFIKWVLVAVLGTALLAASLAGAAHVYIHRPEMIEKIRLFCAERLGTDVRFQQLRINVFEGLKLTSVDFYMPPEATPEIKNPPPFLGIANIRLHYSPLKLLGKKLEFKSIVFDDARLVLARNPDGTWPSSPFRFFKPKEAMSFRTGFLKWDILLDSFELANASILLADSDGTPMYQASKINLNGDLSIQPGLTNAQGRLSIGGMVFGSFFTLTNCTSTFEYANDVLKFPALNARAHGGSASGNAFIDLGIGGPSFGVEIDLQSINLSDMVTPGADVPESMRLRGYLQSKCSLQGSLNQPRLLTGTGSMEIRDVVLPKHVYQNIANELFPDGILPEIGFDKITGSFKIAEERFTFYKLEARAQQLQITGTGTLSFSRKIDLDVMIAFGPELGAILRPEIRSRLNKREDGFFTLTFKISGTLDQPVSNIREKLAAAPAPTVETNAPQPSGTPSQ